MLPARAFWFLRHGETDWNAEGRSQGRTDVPLNPTGVAQAEAAAQLLRRRGIASIVSSPLSRARTTAEAVGKVLDLPVALLDDLQEVCFGVHEGTIQHAAWFTAWVTGEATPQGAESFAILRSRAVSAVTEALAGGDGPDDRCAHAERTADLLRTGHAVGADGRDVTG